MWQVPININLYSQIIHTLYKTKCILDANIFCQLRCTTLCKVHVDHGETISQSESRMRNLSTSERPYIGGAFASVMQSRYKDMERKVME